MQLNYFFFSGLWIKCLKMDCGGRRIDVQDYINSSCATWFILFSDFHWLSYSFLSSFFTVFLSFISFSHFFSSFVPLFLSFHFLSVFFLLSFPFLFFFIFLFLHYFLSTFFNHFVLLPSCLTSRCTPSLPSFCCVSLSFFLPFFPSPFLSVFIKKTL